MLLTVLVQTCAFLTQQANISAETYGNSNTSQHLMTNLAALIITLRLKFHPGKTQLPFITGMLYSECGTPLLQLDSTWITDSIQCLHVWLCRKLPILYAKQLEDI